MALSSSSLSVFAVCVLALRLGTGASRKRSSFVQGFPALGCNGEALWLCAGAVLKMVFSTSRVDLGNELPFRGQKWRRMHFRCLLMLLGIRWVRFVLGCFSPLWRCVGTTCHRGKVCRCGGWGCWWYIHPVFHSFGVVFQSNFCSWERKLVLTCLRVGGRGSCGCLARVTVDSVKYGFVFSLTRASLGWVMGNKWPKTRISFLEEDLRHH